MGSPDDIRRAVAAADGVSAEQRARESARRFEAMADCMPQLVWTATPSGRVDYYNARASHYDGLRRDDAGSWRWEPIVHPDDLDRTVSAWTQALATGCEYTCEHRVRMVDGTYRWHLSRATLVAAATDGEDRWFGTATDIHDRVLADAGRRETAERLAAALTAADRAIEARDHLAATVAHDLRTPLGVLRGTMALLRQSVDDPGPRRDAFFARIDRQIGKMEKLLVELLDLGSLHAGHHLSLHRAEVDLAALARRTVDEHARSASTHRFEVSTRRDVVGRWDPERLERVLDNLLSNAVKYSPEGSRVEVVVDRTGDVADARAVVEVSDEGIGLPDDASSIFDAFVRGTDVGDVPGTGLGLASVRQIVEEHGGEVRAARRSTGGSTFTVVLPVDAAAEI